MYKCNNTCKKYFTWGYIVYNIESGLCRIGIRHHLRQNGHNFFYKICHFFFIWYVVGLLQYSKSAWSKVRTPTVYIFVSCILMPQNCIRTGKVGKCTPYFQCFQVQGYLFYIFKLNNAIYNLGVPSLHHKHHVVLFLFIIFTCILLLAVLVYDVYLKTHLI